MSNILDEIPYIATPRKDTGLVNSKIAIWLFLASEVMLFGGLFSGYIFLRIYSDYPWPERALPVMPGFINTFVLIGSSVTVVFAWAALKMRKYRQFQFYMFITLLCAVGFMVLKTIEYKAKFAHQAVRMETTHAVAEGHFHQKPAEGDDSHGGGHGDHVFNMINFETNTVSLDITRYHKAYIENLIAAAEKAGATLLLKGSETQKLDLTFLDQKRKEFVKARTSNAQVRKAALAKAWEEARNDESNKNDDDRQLAVKVKKIFSEMDLTGHVIKVDQGYDFISDKPFEVSFKPDQIQEGTDKGRLKDDTTLKGKLLPSPVELAIDTLDFRQTARRAITKDIDPVAAIDASWLVSENPEIKAIWERHKIETKKLTERLKKKGGTDEETNEANLVPNENDLYRITWQEVLWYIEDNGVDEELGVFAGFAGPSHYDSEKNPEGYHFPIVEIPRERVAFESNLTPKWNTYYAIYFLMTGLHGLHVIGGAIVLFYFGFCSRKMYDEHPDWLANRVEVGGLFWHFVDLVWIFLFPIMYLM